MGTYFGIYSDGNLINASGEPIQMNSYCEVSAVVKHPDFIKRGYAKQLLKRTTDKIFEDNKTPILQVEQRNINAIKLYEQLGIITRLRVLFARKPFKTTSHAFTTKHSFLCKGKSHHIF